MNTSITLNSSSEGEPGSVSAETRSLIDTTKFSWLVVFFIVLFFRGIQKWMINSKRNDWKKEGRNIFYYSHLQLGFRLPTVIEGFAALYQARFHGIKFMERASLICQRAGVTIARMALMNENLIAVGEPAVLQKIMGSNDSKVLNKPKHLYDRIFIGPLKSSLVSLELDVWRPHRKILNGCFTYKALQSYVGVMNRHGKNFIVDLRKSCFLGNFINSIKWHEFHEFLHFHATKIICEILVGENSLTNDEIVKLHFHFTEAKALTVYRMLYFLNMIPLVWWLNPKSRKLQFHTDKMNEYLAKAVQKCKEKFKHIKKNELQEKADIASPITGNGEDSDSSSSSSFRSLVEEMLQNKASDNEIYGEAGIFLAGHESLITAVQFFLQHIAEHRDIQESCQKEIDALFESKGLSKLTSSLNDNSNVDLCMNDLTDLKYLERCILETLRLTPIFPLCLRHLKGGDTEVEGYHFKEGTTFLIPIWSIHRDPRYYENPEVFDPERFHPENMAKRNPYTFLGFSSGPRNCIGYKVAMMEMKIYLAHVLRNFDVYTTDCVKDIPIHFDITIKPEHDFNITFQTRQN